MKGFDSSLKTEDMFKVELHRHLEGSIRTETYFEEARRQRIALPADTVDELRPYLEYQEGDERTLKYFLTKFGWLRRILTNADTIARITFESLEDAWKSNTVYAELRFNPTGMFICGADELEIARGLRDGIRKAKDELGIRSTVICGIMRDRGMELAERSAAFALRYAGDFVTGMDLFSDETFPADPFRQIFEKTKESGLHLTIHAGEAGGSQNVKEAILFGAERIGHGVHIVQDQEVVELAREREILLEMCPTSNVQTGAVPSIEDHPFSELIKNGIHACINTDDPGVSGIDLNNEFSIAVSKMGVSKEELMHCELDACRYLFDDGLRSIVKTQLQKQYQMQG